MKANHTLLIGIPEITAYQLIVTLEIDNDKARERVRTIVDGPPMPGDHVIIANLQARIHSFDTLIETIRRTAAG